MKILILCDHYPLSPRVKKVRNSLLKLYPSSTIKVFAWNRENHMASEDYVVTFNQDLGYGNKVKKALNLPKFIKQAKLYAKKFNPTYIHAIDIEMLITSTLISSSENLIYEVYDIKFNKPKIIKIIREKIETSIIRKHVKGIIFASPFFDIYYTQIGIRDIQKIVLNNKPSSNTIGSRETSYMNQFKVLLEGKCVIGFIGTVRYQNILINLIDASRSLDNITILISGNGPSYNYIKDYIDNSGLGNKVIMTGRYEIEDLKTIYDACDYVWAAYPNRDLNVKYAVSNKFFESMAFRKKVIVSELTMLGDMVEEIDVGYTVNPYDVEEIYDLLKVLEGECYREDNIIFDEGLFWEDEELGLFNIYQDSKTNVKR